MARHFNRTECRYAFLGASVLPLLLDNPGSVYMDRSHNGNFPS